MVKDTVERSENAKIRDAQRKAKRIEKLLRRKMREQKQIGASKKRLISRSNVIKTMKQAGAEISGLHVEGNVIVRKDAVNAVASIAIRQLMNEIDRCRSMMIHLSKNTLDLQTAEFVLDGKSAPRKAEFKALVE